MANVTVIERDGSKFFPVGTTNSYDVPAGAVVLTANLKETKGTVVPTERKHRNVVIPELSIPESVPKQFGTVLLDKFYNLAESYFKSVMEETDRMAREIPADAFSIDNLIAYFGRQAVSSRLNGDMVAAWFDSAESATGEYIRNKTQGDAAKYKKYRDLFIKSAAPNHGINPNTCTVLLATLQDADADHPIYENFAAKWQATIDKAATSDVDAL